MLEFSLAAKTASPRGLASLCGSREMLIALPFGGKKQRSIPHARRSADGSERYGCYLPK